MVMEKKNLEVELRLFQEEQEKATGMPSGFFNWLSFRKRELENVNQS
jgi:hypothetical protein